MIEFSFLIASLFLLAYALPIVKIKLIHQSVQTQAQAKCEHLISNAYAKRINLKQKETKLNYKKSNE
jgi:hypothetical protein